MTIKQIIAFLEPKNQNLPYAEIKHDFKNIPVIYIPVIENNEKHLSISITEKDIEYIEGRIYEVDYIIEKLWDIIREEEEI